MSLSLDKKHILSKISQINSLHELESFRLEYLGKKGIIPREMKSLTNLEIEQKKIRGQELNTIKQIIETAIIEKKQNIENKKLNEKIKKEKIDVTLPPSLIEDGKIHPISQTIFKIIEIFANLNFSVKTGPDIETDFNNFSALNIPSHHPAREMQDTFYIEKFDKSDVTVLRTHTSPVQVRTMLSSKPPIRIIVPGRTYRSDSDATHTPMFHQVEGLVIDQNSTMADLKSTLLTFLKEFFEMDNIKYRFRPSYFPFTEPSAEMDVAFTKKIMYIKLAKARIG